MNGRFLSGFLLFLVFVSGACTNETINQINRERSGGSDPQEEVFYLVFPRSFYDSDGDRIGDLRGVMQQLDYLQELGITSIIMTPLYPSIYYHNYFADSFEGIDPELGTLDDYLELVREIHRRNMKFYMDTEVQYVTKNHPWFRDSYQNPSSPYSHYIFYKDSLNREPESIIFNMSGLRSFNGDSIDITTVNLYHPEVRKYMTDLFAYWADPNKDGIFDDGVDGFRLDHAMDNLDFKNLLPDMYEKCWAPLITATKAVNPDIKFIAEQADWNDPGADYFNKAGVDIVYAFGLNPLASLADENSGGNPLQRRLQQLLNTDTAGKYRFLFLENHDLPRYASLVHRMKLGKKAARSGAASVLLFKGVPFIYYGQELGMRGESGLAYSVTDKTSLGDGMDIPRREAFEWFARIDSPGMATWYRDQAPYWPERNIKSHDSISVEEEKEDPGSLLNFYEALLALRKSDSALMTGKARMLSLAADSLTSYCRWNERSGYLLVFNFHKTPLTTRLNINSLPFGNLISIWKKKLGDEESSFQITENTLELSLSEMGFLVLGSR